MSDRIPRREPDRGRITNGLASGVFVERTLRFVKEELPKWRDDPLRPIEESEERLNAQLCKFLNVASRHQFPMVYFHHEEKQTTNRRVDFSALPSENQFIGATFHSIYDPFIVFEGKRLPAPSGDREREYVTGGDLKSGGIQRFKLGLHGAKHDLAAIVGYIQERTPREWLGQINDWIRHLANSSDSSGEWSIQEQLADFTEDSVKHIADSRSLHSRRGEKSVSPNIEIRHLWVRMARR